MVSAPRSHACSTGLTCVHSRSHRGVKGCFLQCTAAWCLQQQPHVCTGDISMAAGHSQQTAVVAALRGAGPVTAEQHLWYLTLTGSPDGSGRGCLCLELCAALRCSKAEAHLGYLTLTGRQTAPDGSRLSSRAPVMYRAVLLPKAPSTAASDWSWLRVSCRHCIDAVRGLELPHSLRPAG